MKVLHFAPFMQAGGAAQLASDLAYALQMYDVQSILIAPSGEHISPLVSERLRHLNYRPYPLPGKWGSVLKLRSIVRARRPQILQAYGYEALSIAVRACKPLPPSLRPQLVAAITGYPMHPEDLKTVESLQFAAATCISASLRRALAERSTRLKDAQLIPYGVNETLCYPGYSPSDEKRKQWYAAHPELAGRYVLCLPGPISAPHGTADVVPIMSTLLHQDIPAHLIIAGDTSAADTAFLANLRRRLRSAGLDALVTWIGASPDMRDILCMSDAVLSLTTEAPAYSRPILEALALGKPVAGYANGAISEYLEEMNPVGALPVGNADAAADILSQWHGTPPDSIENIPSPYRLSDTAASYFELYNSLL